MRMVGAHGGAQVLHVLHHALVARGLEVVGRVHAVAAPDQHQDRVGLRERRVPVEFEQRQLAVTASIPSSPASRRA
jgi:hypothetical protein